MSHFTTVVIVPPTEFLKGDKAIRNWLAKKLTRYSEEYEYPTAQRRYLSERQIGGFAKHYDLDISKPNWDPKLLLPYIPKYYGQDIERTGIDKKGVWYETKQNDRGYWDWWRIGGRWDGWIIDKQKASKDHGFNFGPGHESIPDNSILISKMKEPKIPYAIVDPEGEWYDPAITGLAETDWTTLIQTLYDKYQDHYAVSCDTHT